MTGADAGSAPAAPAGPPLTFGQREGLRVAVSQCWNVGSLSTEALRTIVTIAPQDWTTWDYNKGDD